LVQTHVTTEANLENTSIVGIQSYRAGRVPVHKVQLDHQAST
jgi:hypothetical protein